MCVGSALARVSLGLSSVSPGLSWRAGWAQAALKRGTAAAPTRNQELWLVKVTKGAVLWGQGWWPLGLVVLRGPWSSGAWVASVPFLTSFLQLVEVAQTAQRAHRASEPGQELKPSCSSCDVLRRCPSVPPWTHQHVLVSNLLGVGWDELSSSLHDSFPVVQSQESWAWAWLEALGSCCCSARPGWITAP